MLGLMSSAAGGYDMAAGEFEHDGAHVVEELGEEEPDQPSLSDQLLEHLRAGRRAEAASSLRQLDTLDGHVLKILALMIDGDASEEPWQKILYPYRLHFVRWRNHRPKRFTIDFRKSEAIKAVARKIRQGARVKTAHYEVAADLSRSYQYVRDAWYAHLKRQKSKTNEPH